MRKCTQLYIKYCTPLNMLIKACTFRDACIYYRPSIYNPPPYTLCQETLGTLGFINVTRK